jgi:DNA gyrase subunit A
VLNNLYKFTAMQSAFHINMLALIDRQPRVINLKEALVCYVDFRKEVITRRSKFDLQKAKDRAHILEGFKIALDNLDAVVDTIRKSDTVETARINLMKGFNLSQIQAQAILDMQLRRLANLERQKILDEYTEVLKTIGYLEDLLANPKKVLSLIQQDVKELKEKYGDKRRTAIKKDEIEAFEEADLIAHQDVVVTLSEQGYIKRIPVTTYQKQHRYGRGVTGMVTRETDMVRHLTVADTHDHLLLFTNRGKVYRMKCYDVPQDLTRATKGTAIANMLPIDPKEHITAMVTAQDAAPGMFMIMATSRGIVKRTSMDRFAQVRTSGLIAMKLVGTEELVGVSMVSETDKVILVSRGGKAIKFATKDLRIASRTSGGVRGIKLNSGDRLVSMSRVFPEARLLTVTEDGFGKLSKAAAYPLQKRGGKGVLSHKVTPKTGKVIAAEIVNPAQNLIIITVKGIVIRIDIDGEVPLQGRATQGVHLNRLDQDDKVASIALVGREEEQVEKAEEKAAEKATDKAKAEDKPSQQKLL